MQNQICKCEVQRISEYPGETVLIYVRRCY